LLPTSCFVRAKVYPIISTVPHLHSSNPQNLKPRCLLGVGRLPSYEDVSAPVT
jgi:hypothetical protein